MGLSCHRWPGVSSGILMVFSVARVQRVHRGKFLRWMGLGHACGVRVDGAAPRGLWPPAGGGLCSLRSRGNGPSGRGLWYRPQGDEYKVSVTGLAFCVIRYEKHYFDQPPPVAFFPPFGALRHHLARWEGGGTSQATKGGISLTHRAVVKVLS